MKLNLRGTTRRQQAEMVVRQHGRSGGAVRQFDRDAPAQRLNDRARAPQVSLCDQEVHVARRLPKPRIAVQLSGHRHALEHEDLDVLFGAGRGDLSSHEFLDCRRRIGSRFRRELLPPWAPQANRSGSGDRPGQNPLLVPVVGDEIGVESSQERGDQIR